MRNLYLAFCLLTLAAKAQMGALDHSFNAADNGTTKQITFNQFGDLSYLGSAPVLLANGKVLVISPWDSKIYCYNSNGTIDSTFQSPGFGEGSNYSPYDRLYLQPDGKIIAAYSATGKMFRFSADGVVDTTFTPPVFSMPSNSTVCIYDVDFQADGKILVAGSFTSVNSYSQKRFTRLNANGTVDTTFNMGGGFSNTTSGIAVQADGKIVVVGYFVSYDTSGIDHIVRINTNGSVDTSFSLTSGSYFNPSANAYGVDVLPSGKIVVVGTEDLYRYNNQNKKGIVRLNANGSYDTSFNAQPFMSSISTTTLDKVAAQPDGKILVYKFEGSATNYQNYFRLNADGSKDTGFNSTMSLADGYVERFVLQPDGKIIIGSSYYNPATGITRKTMHRVNANGSLDVSFLPNTSTNNWVYRSFVQQDGKILLIGKFTTYNDQYAPGMARIDINGNLDTSFSADPTIKLPYSYSGYPVIKQQADGKILIAGYQYSVENTIKNIIRLNTNGSIDNSFNNEAGSVTDFELLPDGKIIAIGSGGSYSSNNAYKVRKFNTDGTLDTSYISYNFDKAPNTIELLPDGKLLVGGDFEYYNNSGAYKLIRLNPDGSRDTAFNYNAPGYFASDVTRILRQPDGNILITYISQGGSSKIARLLSDGSLDTSFTINQGTLDGYGLNNMILMEDGRILVPKDLAAGFNGQPAPDVLLINANGTWDNTYGFNYFPNGTFYSLAGCDRLIATGEFTTIGSTPKHFVAAVNVSPNPVPPSGPNVQYVAPGETIGDLDVNGQNVLWYLQPVTCENAYYAPNAARSAMDANTNLPLPASTPLVNGTTYYGTQTVNTLESRFALSVKAVFQTPAALPDVVAGKTVLFPNPTKGQLTISGTEAIQQVLVYNSIGQLVMSQHANGASVLVNLSNLENGLYIVKAIAAGGVSDFTIVKN